MRTTKGDRYKGTFLRNIKDGVGIFRWANGDVFSGVFQNDKPIEGLLKYKDGDFFLISKD